MSEDLLVDYLESGDLELFEKLERKTRDKVYSVAFRILCNEALSEEATQEVYLKVCKRRLHAEAIRNGEGYLCAMARREALMKLRRDARRVATELEVARDEAWRRDEEHGYSREDLLDVRDAVFDLPQPLRWYVELRYLEELSIKEVAMTVHAPERTVYARLLEARRALRSKLSASSAPIILPILTGEANVFWPGWPVPRALARRLDGMALKARLLGAKWKGPRRRHQRSSRSVAASLALTAVIFLGGGASLHLLGSGRGQMALLDKPKAPLKEDAGGKDEAPLMVLGPQGPPKEAMPDRVDGAKAIEQPQAAEPKAQPEAREKESPHEAEEKKPLASIVIRAVDQRGNLLRQGMLVMKLVGEPDPDEEIISGKTSLELDRDPIHIPWSLAQQNPLGFEGIPEALNGQEVLVRVRTGGVYVGEPAKLRIEAGKLSEAEVVASVDDDREVTVKDALTGEPIEEAVLRARPRSTLVNVPGEKIKLATLMDAVIPKEVELKALGGGRFLLPGLLSGASEKRVLEVGAEGYSPAKCFEEELEPEGVLWLQALVTREPTGSMTVTVLNARGRPWPGVEVEVVGFDLSETRTTDGRGQCRWESLRATEYALNIRYKPDDGNFEKDSERLNQRSVRVKAEEETHVVFGERKCSGSLSLELVDGLNRPRAEMKVSLRGTLETYRATTDRRGRAKLEGVAPESYSLCLGETDGWELSKIVVHDGEKLCRRFALGRAAIRGHIVFGDGEDDLPSCDVKVRALGERSAWVMAAKDGTFEISDALPGKYSLFAMSTDQKRFSEKVEVLVPHVGGPKASSSVSWKGER
jgi:RNA polymerase sigma-70 factor (ECF subfamily)